MGDSSSQGVPSVEARGALRVSAPSVDPRVVEAWCVWLDALATDAEAALAAAIAYQGLEGVDRDQWLTVLEQDFARVNVPRIAVYAPLLAVESDPARRARIEAAMGPADEQARPSGLTRCLLGIAPDRTRVAAIVSPLYLDFVQVLACGYRPTEGFLWVKHDPIVSVADSPRSGAVLAEVRLEAAPVAAVVDELALTVLAHRRSGREIPDAVRIFADLFGPSSSVSSSKPPPLP